jgi:hypothetical protein
MTSTMPTKIKKQPSVAARRTGYIFSVVINAALLFGINVWPGWDVLPFLSDDFSQLLGLINASLWLSLAIQVVYLVNDRKPVKQLGDIVSLILPIVIGVRMWQLFPFDFGTQTFDWELLFRIAIAAGIVGMAIAIVVNLVSLFTDSHSRS